VRPYWKGYLKLALVSCLPRDNQGENRATIRMRMAPGVG
jgi:non-homologous end joining protein Ku